jgi:hypothetical protein
MRLVTFSDAVVLAPLFVMRDDNNPNADDYPKQ